MEAAAAVLCELNNRFTQWSLVILSRVMKWLFVVQQTGRRSSQKAVHLQGFFQAVT